MKYRGLLATAMSGSADGIVASHNRGGQYFRRRATPTNPGSAAQVAVRNVFGSLASRWSQVLTDAQREAWTNYAQNTPRSDALGEELILTGAQMYIRGNSVRQQAGLAIVDDGPSTFGLPEFSDVGITSITASTGVAIVTYEDADAWLDQDDAAMVAYFSQAVSPAKNFFKGPYRYSDSIQGDSTTPPSSPQNVTSVFSYTAGQKVFLKLQVVDEEGRLSTPFLGGQISV